MFLVPIHPRAAGQTILHPPGGRNTSPAGQQVGLTAVSGKNIC